MSANNTLDQNRVDAMISAALEQNESLLPKLREMADRYSEPADALAKYLVGDEKSDPDFYEEGCPCDRKQWDYFMSRCRKMTSRAPIQNREQLARCAAIGRWPEWLPSTTMTYQIEDEFFSLEFTGAWANLWLGKPEDWNWLLNGHTPFWRPCYRDHGWIVADGLLKCLERKLLEVPEEKQVDFVMAWGKWYTHVDVSNANVSSVCWALGMQNRLETFTEKELQALAVYWDRAAAELAKRRVPLALPEVQCWRPWVDALESVLFSNGGTVDEAVETYKGSKNPFVKWALINKWSRFAYVSNPDDPFGPSVSEFMWKAGIQKAPDFPTYEDAEAYLETLKGK